MAIPQSEYVSITSSVGGATSIPYRDFMARLFTTNQMVPPQAILEFSGANALSSLGSYFGTESDIYVYANKYFSWISKAGYKADKISIARYALNATSAQLINTQILPVISEFKAITNGTLIMTLNDTAREITGINLSTATDMAAVATAIQSAIRAPKDSEQLGEEWTQATVVFENQQMIFTAGTSGPMTIDAATVATGEDVQDLAYPLRWSTNALPVISYGVAGGTLTEELTRIDNISNNCGSINFIETLSSDQITEVAQWVDAGNVTYMYPFPVTNLNYVDLYNAVNGMNGAGAVLDIYGDYSEYMPAVILATINWDDPDATVNFMFNKFNTDKPTVTDLATKQAMDSHKINYLGDTQDAGTHVAFFQDGYLMGDIQDMIVYAGEMFMKSRIKADFMNMLLALKKIPANTSGKALGRGIIQTTIDKAIDNGVISVGKTLTEVQKAYVVQISGDSSAPAQIENNGYWLEVDITEFMSNTITKFKLDYLLLYSKGDVVRKVEGRDIMI